MRKIGVKILLSVLLSAFSLSLFGAETVILVSVTGPHPPTVQVFSHENPTLTHSLTHSLTVDSGIVFFVPRSSAPEQWVHVQGEVPSLQTLKDAHLRLVGSSRGSSGQGSSGAIADTIPAQTLQLEQLLAFTLNRNLPDYSASVVFSPADGSVLLSPKPTFRRLPATQDKTGEKTGKKTLPPVSARLFQGEQFLLEIRFAEGQDTVAWQEIPALPERFRDGLAPGDYVLKTDGTDKVNCFTVKPTELRDWMFARIARIESLLGPDDPVSVQVAAEMLVYDNVDGPFFTDALDRIAALEKEKSTPYLENFQSFLVFRLSGREGIVRGNDGRLPQDEKEVSEEAAAEADPIADAALIHRLLLNEKWSVAAIRLDRLEEKLEEKLGRSDESVSMRELRALCSLYRGMILAESGVSRLQEGYAAFSEAVRQLDVIAGESAQNAELVAASRFRTANNFGNFLLRLTQDRLYNHALAMATGDGTVLTGALLSWSQALSLYQMALSLSESFLPDQPELAATAKINLARLYAVLGDMVRTVDSAAEACGAIESAALRAATMLANEVIGMNLPNEERLKGAAHHILADLAFRQSDRERCFAEAALARRSYVQTGTLSGVEAIERLLGMLERGDRKAALKHLAISSTLSDVMREQVPTDRIGLSRAGFFARRAYVNERMIELLLQDGKPVEALTVLEAAKGRSLQDILNSAGLNSDAESENTRSIEEILADWPKDIAAIEYFIGSENCWGFLIQNGSVEAFPIKDDSETLCSPHELVTLTQNTLLRLQMGLKLMRGGDYGREWEDGLYRLRCCLVPDVILQKLRRPDIKRLLVSPHHILHYLPFCALVVEKDPLERGVKEVAMPQYLLDEYFDILTTPSLVFWDTIRQRRDSTASAVTMFGISKFSELTPLNGINDDVRNTRKVFGENGVEFFLEERATKENFLKKLSARGIMIVSTHGINFPQNPLESRIILRDEEGKDSAITAREFFSSSIGADLVLLNACETGLADQTPLLGDDLFGIQRALLISGARSVISSEWNVFDRTGPRIIGCVLKHIALGEDAVHSLAIAQRKFLEEERTLSLGPKNEWLHPYFWAVYTIVGGDDLFWQQNTKGPK